MKPTVFREFIRYCIPSLFGMLGLSCYILADTFFVARGLGVEGLAALNLAIPVYSVIHGTGLMLGVGGATRFSIQKSRSGSGEENGAFTQSIFAGGIFAGALFLMGLFFAGPVTTFLGADTAVYSMSKIYLQMLLLFSPVFLLNEILLGFVRNDGGPGLAMGAMVGGSLSNILLDYIFIFPLQMGIFGAVLATCIAPVISLCILTPFFVRKKNTFHFTRNSSSAALLGKIFAGGLPSLLTELSGGVVMTVFNQILLRLGGNVSVAAYGVIANLSLVVLAMYTGISQGIQPIISRSYGCRDLLYAKKTLGLGLCFTGILSVLVYTGVFLGAGPITGLFNSEQNPALYSVAVKGLRIYFIGGLFAGCNIVLSAYFAAGGYTRGGNALSFLRGFVLILPLAFFLSNVFGIAGLWASFPATEFLTAVLAAALYSLHHKRVIRK